MTEEEADITELPSSPGARLRREREARGLTQQQAAEQLTLDVSVVTALEANDFAALGAPVFAKGHLRRYAGMLDLPADDILGGYERSKGQPEQPTLVPRSRVEMMPVRNPPKWPWVLGGGVAFLFAAAIAAYVSANGLHLPWSADSQSDAESLAADAAPTENPAIVAQTRSATTPASGAPAGCRMASHTFQIHRMPGMINQAGCLNQAAMARAVPTVKNMASPRRYCREKTCPSPGTNKESNPASMDRRAGV